MNGFITLAHGSGGKASHALITSVFVPVFGSQEEAGLEDSALLHLDGRRIAFSTDSYVVDPIFFPGGDIGTLAVHGTVNDIAMRGGRPLYLSVAMILEEGLAMDDLARVVGSMKKCADGAGVTIVTGDTKVVPKGKADKIFINTSGIGLVKGDTNISAANGKVGDVVLVSGTMGDHGATILCQREGLAVTGSFASDSAPLNDMVFSLLDALQDDLHVLRDPTRGGLATTLNELAHSSAVGIRIREHAVPIRGQIRGVCEFLGLDPLYLANEGKLIAMVASHRAEEALALMRKDRYGAEAAIIGTLVAGHPGQVALETTTGGSRILDMLHGEALPRIC